MQPERTRIDDSVRVRQANAEDAEICGRICYEAFAKINREHGFPPEIDAPDHAIGLIGMLFSHPGFYPVVAEKDGRIIGSNCLDERSTIAGIGPITIDPDAQNCGAGRILMRAVMDRAAERRFPGVRLLQAAFHGRSLSLYTKLGFDVREPMTVFQGRTLERPALPVRPATEADIAACNQLCMRVHGHTRDGELRDAVDQGSAKIVERGGRVTGYASGLAYFAHAVGETNEDIQALIASAERFEGPGIIVPTRNAELFRWCLNQGLRVVLPLTLMTVGLYNEPKGAYLPSILY